MLFVGLLVNFMLRENFLHFENYFLLIYLFSLFYNFFVVRATDAF